MSLEQWLRNTWLQRCDPTVADVEKLFQVVDRNLSDAQATGLSADGQFQHAYDAALQLCMIALKASGYVARKGEGHHKRGIESLRYTLGVQWSGTADHIELCSRQRGQAMYDQIDVVNEQDATDLLNVAKQLHADVIEWLRSSHSELLPAKLKP